MADFKGDVQSRLEKNLLNRRVTNRDLLLASMNPLVKALSSTDTQMKFSKPFYHNVYDPKGKVDVELSHDIAESLDAIDFFSWAQVADSDAFVGGRGISELAYGKNSESGYIEYTAMERRPFDSFLAPKDPKITSTALRWKGLFYKNGALNFDQTIADGPRSGQIISLDPKQVFSLAPLGSRFIDESILEYLLVYIDLAAYAYDLIYVVMSQQLNPSELIVADENLPGNDAIAQKILENNNAVEKVAIPSNMRMEHPKYSDRKDVLSFYSFAQRELYKIVFPISALSDGAEGKGGALLDNSSAAAKMSTFFAYIQSGREKLCKEINKVGNNWLDFNGFKKQGYKYACIASPIEPKDVKNELQIMISARKSGDISLQEYRSWINSCVIGIKLEENFEANNDLGQKTQPRVDPAINKAMDKIANGDDVIQAMVDVVVP
jgi:hypothetical protein